MAGEEAKRKRIEKNRVLGKSLVGGGELAEEETSEGAAEQRNRGTKGQGAREKQLEQGQGKQG